MAPILRESLKKALKAVLNAQPSSILGFYSSGNELAFYYSLFSWFLFFYFTSAMILLGKTVENLYLIGKIIKIHSDFYYVKVDCEQRLKGGGEEPSTETPFMASNQVENKIFECKIREKLKKEKIEIYVGDLVKIEEVLTDCKVRVLKQGNSFLNQAAIIEVFPRNNYLPRPSISNVDQVIIVAALAQSELDFGQLNRYLCQAKLYDIPAVICINKSDLNETLKFKQKILDIYENIGYKIVFTSALTGLGVEELKNILESKVSVLSGMSGVGKTSLLNKIHPDLKLKTKEISLKTGKGTHSTRHVEILEIPCENGKTLQVADTPGFSYLRFDTVMPSIINELFDEIKELSSACSFSDCLHLTEDGCNVLANLNQIDSARYESYKVFTQEAIEYKEKIRKEGHKEEKSSKSIDTGSKETKQMVKLNTQARKKARNTEKQKMNLISILDEVYYNQEEFD